MPEQCGTGEGWPGEMVTGLRGDWRIVSCFTWRMSPWWLRRLGSSQGPVRYVSSFSAMVLDRCNGRGTSVEFRELVPIVGVRHLTTVAREPPCIEHLELVSNLLVFLSCLILLTPLWGCLLLWSLLLKKGRFRGLNASLQIITALCGTEDTKLTVTELIGLMQKDQQ